MGKPKAVEEDEESKDMPPGMPKDKGATKSGRNGSEDGQSGAKTLQDGRQGTPSGAGKSPGPKGAGKSAGQRGEAGGR